MYYVVDATHLKVVETDAGAQLVGDAYKQPAGPFNNASIARSFAFAMLGSTSTGVFGEGGVLTLSSTGAVTAGTIDINKNGNPNPLAVTAGNYNVADATTGRTTVTVTAGGLTFLYAAYPQINGALSVVEIDTSNVVAGRALAQKTEEDIKSGAVMPFMGPIKAQDGSVKVAASQMLDDGAIAGMDWMAEGVEGQLPK